jgi:glutamate/tyrosine decarboxylase-like PLP-dependent enzyme
MPPESPFRGPLHLALRHAIEYLDRLDTQAVDATIDLETLRARLGKPLNEDELPPEQVIDDLVRDAEGGIIGNIGGRFFGWVIGGALPASLAADWLTAAWDQNAGLYASGQAAAVAEEVAGAWLKDILGLPAEASFAFVTGCQMAHTTCLAAARHGLLARTGWDVERKGLYGAPPIRIFSSTEHHGTIHRSVRVLGMGLESIIQLSTDEQGRLRPDALAAALERAAGSPSIVLLQAGDLNIGAYDDFEKLIPIAHRHGAWVHVDGAFGLWANASPRYRHLLRGVEVADSWATDGHKWLNVPHDCGYALVRDSASHRAAMSYRASYLIHADQARDQMDWNPEWSRRARGFATYAALRQLGRKGIAGVVERCCRHAHSLVLGIGSLPAAEILWEPAINQGLVRFLDPMPGATEEDHDRRTDAVIAAIRATGEVFFGGTTWRGRRAMRVSVCNWITSERDVERSIAAARTILLDLVN